MGLHTTTKYKKLFKGILAVTYLVFFTAQLSCRFHSCANFPLFNPHSQVQPQKLTAAGIPDPIRIDRKMLLSVDKRYHLQHIFALDAPLFRIDRMPALISKSSDIYCQPPIPFPAPCISLRGP